MNPTSEHDLLGIYQFIMKSSDLSAEDFLPLLARLAKRRGRCTDIFAWFSYFAGKGVLPYDTFCRALCCSYFYGGTGAGLIAKRYFSMIKKTYLWNDQQKAAFAALPQQVKLYRAAGEKEVVSAGLKDDGETLAHPSNCGVSWTPIIKRALYFGEKWYNHSGGMDFILETTVNKERLKTYYWFAQDKECILLCNDTDCVKAVRRTVESHIKNLIELTDGEGKELSSFFKTLPNGFNGIDEKTFQEFLSKFKDAVAEYGARELKEHEEYHKMWLQK